MDWLIIGAYAEKSLGENTSLCKALILYAQYVLFVVQLHIDSSVWR